MDLREQLEGIATREDLSRFVLALRQDLVDNPSGRENRSLDQFLEALAAWCLDMPGYFANRGDVVPDSPDWQVIGHLLLAASMYE